MASTEIEIKRQIFTQIDLNNAYIYEKTTFTNHLKKFNWKNVWIFFRNLIPFIVWIREYKFKSDFIMDLCSGTTVMFIQIPQSIAYGLLANVPAVSGIYVAIVSSLCYMFFGTSKHLNTGTFAIVCLETGNVVSKFSSFNEDGDILMGAEPPDTFPKYKNIDVLLAVTFTCAIFHLLIFICRLGKICILLSDVLVNAFQIACSIHIITSQLKELLGLKFTNKRGYFRIIYTWYEIIKTIKTANYFTIIFATISLVILICYNEIFKPKLAKKCRIPFPIEITIMSIGILISSLVDLKVYNIHLVGFIPKGFPVPKCPQFQIIPYILIDCIPLSIISYIITQTIVLLFARKGNYKIDHNQEALAFAISNLFGSFTYCVPTSGSMVRTIINFNIGARSQISSAICAILLIILIYFIGPAIELLPKAIVSSVVISAVYRALFEAGKLKIYWKLCKTDVLAWFITFFVSVFIDIGLGILTAMIVSFITICVQHFINNSHLLGAFNNTEIYLETRNYKELTEFAQIKIFRYKGVFNYVTCTNFVECLSKATNINRKNNLNETKVVIIDFSCINFIDSTAITDFLILKRDYKEIGIEILITNISAEVYETLRLYKQIFNKPEDFLNIFLTVHDAVIYTQLNILNKNVEN